MSPSGAMLSRRRHAAAQEDALAIEDGQLAIQDHQREGQGQPLEVNISTPDEPAEATKEVLTAGEPTSTAETSGLAGGGQMPGGSNVVTPSPIAATPEPLGNQQRWLNGPIGMPESLCPKPLEEHGEQSPLFSQGQLKALEEMQMRSPMLFHEGGRSSQNPWKTPEVRRPDFMQEEEMRSLKLQLEKERHQAKLMKDEFIKFMQFARQENATLKEELMIEKAMYQTPSEDGARAQQGRFEDGARAQQGRLEDGARAQQGRFEDGARAQQGRLEDGARAQQGRFEDGARAQQGRLEDGARAQQGSSEDGTKANQGLSAIPPGSKRQATLKEAFSKSPKFEEPKPSTEGGGVPGLDIMLKLMEGMQQMQRQILDHGASKRSRSEERDEESMEYVRYNQEMPKLPEWDPETAPIDFSDWLLVLTPVVGDLSATSSEWWAIVLESAKKWYEDHMQMSPLERLDHQALEPPEMKRHKWGRLEKRVSNLLLAALPPSQKEEVIAAKDLRVMSILTKTMLVFQPGGLNEKSAILHALEAPPEATSVTQGLLHLRRWTRWKRRASEVGVSMPDATILVRGLNKMLRKILAANPHLEFRVNLVRSNLMIDTAPTYEKVSHFAQSVLAELDSVAYADRRKKDVGDPKENVKMKKFEEGGGKGKGKSREDDQKEDAQKTPCKFYLTEGGCKKGRQCTWSHDLKDDKRRCYSCGSPAHLSNACTVKNNQKDQGKPKIASAKKEEDTGGLKSSDRGAPASPVPSDTVEVGSSASGEETMKGLLEEANKMLRSMATPSEGDKLQKLQRQLDELRSGGPQMKVFRLSKMGTETHYGLLDSGATHPLRGRWPKERLVAYPDVPVTLAGGQEVKMKLAPTGAIVSQDPRVEPIVPMGALMTQLGCKLCWTLEGLEVEHPSRGRLEVKMQGDCPMVPRSVALDLIHELEEKARRTFRSLGVGEDAEVKFIQMLVESHPVFEGVPEHQGGSCGEARGDAQGFWESEEKETLEKERNGDTPLLWSKGWVSASKGR